MHQSSACPAFWRAVAGVGGDELHAAGTWQNLDRLSLLAPPSFALHLWTSLLSETSTWCLQLCHAVQT